MSTYENKTSVSDWFAYFRHITLHTAKLLLSFLGIVARRRKQKSKAGLMTNGTCNLRPTFF